MSSQDKKKKSAEKKPSKKNNKLNSKNGPGLRIRFILIFVGGTFIPLVVVLYILGVEINIMLGITVAALFLFTVFLGNFVANYIITPIEKLHKAATEFGKQNFTYRVSLKRKGEFQELGKTFNDMASRIKRLYEREKNISTMKSEFISVAAHQMRTPLSAIKWTFSLLLDEEFGALNEKQRDAVKEGSEVSDQMVQIVDDLLNVSRIEEGRFGFEFEKISIEDVLDDIVKEERLRAQEEGITLVFHRSRERIPDIKLDAGKIRIAFSNLIDNAIKYTPAGKRVEIRVKKTNDSVVVSVEDEGIGIPEEELPKLFSKFFRAKNAVRTHANGSGLGLYITKNIIDRHGGDISVDSKEGEGSTFSVKLPIHPQKKREEQEEGFMSFVEGL